jgi:O-antigen ligase
MLRGDTARRVGGTPPVARPIGAFRPSALDWICAIAVISLGTSNLWKAGGPGILPVDPTAASLGAVLLLVALSFINHDRIPGRPWVPAVMGFATFLPALLWTTGASDYSAEKSRTLFTTVFLCVAAPMVLIVSPRRRNAFVLAALVVGLVTAGWLLASGSMSIGGRVTVGDANPIALGRLAATGFVVAAVVALRRRGWVRLISVLAALTCAVAALSTGSRGPAVTGVLAIVVVSLMNTRRRKIQIGMAVVVLMVGCWQAAVQFAPSSAMSRIMTGDHGGAQSTDQRERLLTEAIGVARDNPWGVGWGQLADHLDRAAYIVDQGSRQYPHNVLVEAAAEGGLLALGGLLVLLVVSAARLYAGRSDMIGQALIALWIVAAGSAMTSSDLIGNRMMWMMIGVGLVTRHPGRSTPRVNDPAARQAVSGQRAGP